MREEQLMLWDPLERDDVEEKLRMAILSDEGIQLPTPGRIVWYQTDGRGGLDYYLAAIVSVTQDSHPGDYPDGSPNPLAVPSSQTHVHLTVFTPGGFGSHYFDDRGEEETFNPKNQGGLDQRPAEFRPGSGTYVEHDVPHDPQGSPRSWRWPDRS